MADVEFTMATHNVCPRCAPSVDIPRASERANADHRTSGRGTADKAAATEGEQDGLVTPLEEALEEERARLMLANSVLGCLQIALDPEAITVTPAAYFPEVLELARQFINRSVRQLEYGEIRRLMRGSLSG